MSKSQAIAFFEEISKNNKLAQEVEEVAGGNSSNETKAKELLSLANDHGFNFTKEEAARAQGALKTSLSPEDMLEVSGGKLNLKSSVMAAAMLLGLGVGGATVSHMEASAMDGGNHQEIQVPEEQTAASDQGQQEAAPEQHVDANRTEEHVSAETLSYNYVRNVLEFIRERPEALFRRLEAWSMDFEQEIRGFRNRGLSSDLVHTLMDLIIPNAQRVITNRKVDSAFIKDFVAAQRLLGAYGLDSDFAFDGGNTVELIRSHAIEVERMAADYLEDANSNNWPDFADLVAATTDPIVAAYRALVDRVQANGGIVDDAILNDLIEVCMDEFTAYHKLDVEDFPRLMRGEGLECYLNWNEGMSEAEARRRIEEDIARVIEDHSVIKDSINQLRKYREARERAEREAREAREARERATATATAPHPAQQNRETGGRQQIFTGSTMLQIKGTNYVEAWSDTHIHSLSNNDLIHEGNGGADIDRGDIKVSDLRNGRQARNVNIDVADNVVINDATSVTPAPGITMRTQNGTEFTMGATREETIDNLIPDVQLGAHLGRDTQQRNLNFNNPRLQRMLAWAMERFGLSGQDLIDFVQHFFLQGG